MSEKEFQARRAEDWPAGILFDAPDSWCDDPDLEYAALRYVAELEQRCDEAGISRERHAPDTIVHAHVQGYEDGVSGRVVPERWGPTNDDPC